MNMKDIRAKAKNLGVKVAVGSTKVAAVRSIQEAEGYESCFGRGLHAVCGQTDCCFRSDCERLTGEDD